MKTKKQIFRATLAILSLMVIVIIVVIPKKSGPPHLPEDIESPDSGVQHSLLENGGVEMSSNERDEFYDLPVPISAKDLHNLKPVDDRTLIVAVKTEFMLDSMVVLGSSGDVDESHIREGGQRIAEVL